MRATVGGEMGKPEMHAALSMRAAYEEGVKE
jgi:hypothetical protein